MDNIISYYVALHGHIGFSSTANKSETKQDKHSKKEETVQQEEPKKEEPKQEAKKEEQKKSEDDIL